ncbi:hypothetical protein L1S34_14420, partial [Flavobacterium sp. K77]|uniref:hypothetical protein n=1 Tax=Flavobacterium sp. K77 TaxID=2910676 RepID=UPI001F3226B9
GKLQKIVEMTNLEKELLNIESKVGLRISLSENTISINQIFQLKNKSTIGLILLLIGGATFLAFPFLGKKTDISSLIICSVFGLLFFGLSLLSLVRQTTDHTTIKNGKINFIYNLRSFSIPINNEMTIDMKTEILNVRSSSFIQVNHYLLINENRKQILNFQTEKNNSEEAKLLGNYITQILNEKLQLYKASH